MKESYWGYWLIVLGIFIIVVLLLVQSFTSTNSQDYYMVKQITESSMEDAIDWAYYRTYGELKINKEKFIEVFLRRFAEEASIVSTYKITFSDIYEAPPKVSVEVKSKSSSFSITGDSESFDIVNKIDGILEVSNYNSTVTKDEKEYFDVRTNPEDYLNEDKSIAKPIVKAGCKYDFKLMCREDVCNNPLEFNIDYCGYATASGISNENMKDGVEYCYAKANKTGTEYGFIASYESFIYGYVCAKEE